MVEHPTASEILVFRGGGADAETARATGGHIAGCDRCQAIYRGAIVLERRIAEAFQEGVPGTSCPEDWEIAAVIAGEAGRDEVNRISFHLQECHYCLDRSARYQKAFGTVPSELKAPEKWKQAAARVLQNAPREYRLAYPGRILEFLKGISAALPPIPGYAAAVILVIALLYSGDRKTAFIVPSTEKITYREAEPNGSLGFMGQEGSRPPGKSMDLRSSGDMLVFRWEPPTDHSRYSFSVIEKQDGRILWSHPDMKGTKVVLPRNLFFEDKLYAWLIEVSMPDGRKIEYTGDFLYRK